MPPCLSIRFFGVLAAAATCAAAAPGVTPFSPAVLPGNGLAQHPFLYAGEWDTRKADQSIFLVRGGRVVWTASSSCATATPPRP